MGDQSTATVAESSNNPNTSSTKVTSKPLLEVVVIMDVTISSKISSAPLDDRKEALDQITKACDSISAKMHHLSLHKLEFGEAASVDLFHSADVAIVDLSIFDQQKSLFLLLGTRQAFATGHNILIFNEITPDAVSVIKSTISTLIRAKNFKNTTFFTYSVKDHSGVKYCIVNDASITTTSSTSSPTSVTIGFGPSTSAQSNAATSVDPILSLFSDGHFSASAIEPKLLRVRLIKMLKEVQIQPKTHMKDKFLTDLRKARETFEGEELAAELNKMRQRLNDPNVISDDVIHNVMFTYRDLQDYDAMVKLFEELESVSKHKSFSTNPAILSCYMFALNRRNGPGDREKALSLLLEALKKPENEIPDNLGLCGRIYKDKFVESNYEDMEALKCAIEWYRKGFYLQQSEYNAINLATLLVVSGETFKKCAELQSLSMILYSWMGTKGRLEDLLDYWEVAIFFEISVITEDYETAVQAAKCMFKLKPPFWYLRSTMGNIQLIRKFRKKEEEKEGKKPPPEVELFNFWAEYFANGIITDQDEVNKQIRFPVLIYERPSKKPTTMSTSLCAREEYEFPYIPSSVTVNESADPKSVSILNICKDCLKSGPCLKPHSWNIPFDLIRGVSLYKQDERCVNLYVFVNSDDFQMYFPSDLLRRRFYELTRNNDTISDLADLLETDLVTEFEYEYDENERPKVLGKGTYGVVYAGLDKNHRQVAVKEIPIKQEGEVQPLQEEIRLHSQLRHRNIVQYLGSCVTNTKFQIIMERVPGGSLSDLISNKWGPLSESCILFYAPQIIDGLRYLHSQWIVHRDIKGDNVLINTYTGLLKISDFGTSKRLAALNPSTETFTGTFQYMAPEVIHQGQRGYGPPADIWSFGCTVVEMATGKPPYSEIGYGAQVVYHVGTTKSPPEFPDELSDVCKDFILKCFDPEPHKRATAEQLLSHGFLKKKGPPTSRITCSADYLRSLSVPAEQVMPRPGTTRMAASTEERYRY